MTIENSPEDIKRGYRIVESWKPEGAPDDCDGIPSAFSLMDGGYIGNPDYAQNLIDADIQPQLADPEHGVCSIGYCAKEFAWYGWSHRAMCGFKVGSQITRDHAGYRPTDKEDFVAHTIDFWRNEHIGEIIPHLDQEEEIRHAGEVTKQKGVRLEYVYNDTVPNESLRGKTQTEFFPYPEKWGRGEWEAENLDDAMEMAKDFAEAVS